MKTAQSDKENNNDFQNDIENAQYDKEILKVIMR